MPELSKSYKPKAHSSFLSTLPWVDVTDSALDKLQKKIGFTKTYLQKLFKVDWPASILIWVLKIL